MCLCVCVWLMLRAGTEKMIINGFVDVIGPPPLRGQPRFILHSRNEVHTKKNASLPPPPHLLPPSRLYFLDRFGSFF